MSVIDRYEKDNEVSRYRSQVSGSGFQVAETEVTILQNESKNRHKPHYKILVAVFLTKNCQRRDSNIDFTLFQWKNGYFTITTLAS